MKKISNKMTIPEIIDGICELEGYIEYLEDLLKNNWNPFTRKQTHNELISSKKKLTRLNNMLNAA